MKILDNISVQIIRFLFVSFFLCLFIASSSVRFIDYQYQQIHSWFVDENTK